MPDYGDQQEGQGRHSYSGTVDPLAPSVSNGQITPEQWAEYQSKRRRSAILGILGTLGGMAGGGALAGALGGGGAAAGSATASVPGAVGASAAPLGVGTVSAAPIGAGLGAGMGTGAGASLGAAGAAAAGGAAKSLLGLSPQQWASIALGGAGLVGSQMSNRNVPTSPTSATTDPNMQKLIATMQGRLDQSEPLYKSIMAMANGLLPTQYQNGGAGR